MNIYDFDGTLYRGDSTVDFILFCLKKQPALVRFLPGQAWAVCLYKAGSIPKTRMKERLYRIFSGCNAEGLLEEFWDSHEKNIFPWYPGKLQRQDDIVISASPEFLLRPICRRLGIRHLIASRVDPKTGAYTGENCWGPEKVVRLKAELNVDRCDAFYSDRYSDQPLADIAEEAFLVVKGQIRPWEAR